MTWRVFAFIGGLPCVGAGLPFCRQQYGRDALCASSHPEFARCAVDSASSNRAVIPAAPRTTTGGRRCDTSRATVEMEVLSLVAPSRRHTMSARVTTCHPRLALCAVVRRRARWDV